MALNSYKQSSDTDAFNRLISADFQNTEREHDGWSLWRETTTPTYVVEAQHDVIDISIFGEVIIGENY